MGCRLTYIVEYVGNDRACDCVLAEITYRRRRRATLAAWDRYSVTTGFDRSKNTQFLPHPSPIKENGLTVTIKVPSCSCPLLFCPVKAIRSPCLCRLVCISIRFRVVLANLSINQSISTIGMHRHHELLTRICAAEMAVRYAALSVC